MHKTAFAVALAFAVATLGTSSLYAATDGATEPDAITGATKKRESHSGAFRLTDTKEGQTLRDLYEERVPLYEKYADLTAECGGKSIRAIVEELSAAFNIKVSGR